MTSRDFGFLTLRNTTAYQSNGSPVPPNRVFVTSSNGSAIFSDNVSISTLNASTINVLSLNTGFQLYNSTNISSNFGKNILLRSSTISTVSLSSIVAENGTFINFINWSNIPYNIITTGSVSNYLTTYNLLTTFYTTIDELGWIAPSYYRAASGPPPPINTSSMIVNVYISSLSEYSTVILPFNYISSLDVNWGNGFISSYITAPTYTYNTISSYTITINGTASSYGFIPPNVSQFTISSVSQWGTLGLTSLAGAFSNASNLISVPTTIPYSVTDMTVMFYKATNFNQDISGWNTSNVTNMLGMFIFASSFNQPLNIWNVSNVSDMSAMFKSASSFNQNISSWNVSSVIAADYIFCNCPVLNDTQKYPHINPSPIWGCEIPLNAMVINISTMPGISTMTLPFNGISSINVDWGDGLISSYTTAPTYIYSNTMSYIIIISGAASSYGLYGGNYGYAGAYLISSISQWGTLGISSLEGALYNAQNLVSLPSTIPSTVIEMQGMLFNTIIFNGDISSWDVSRVKFMDGMFQGASSFNQNISGWNTSSATSMTRMFKDASSFNQNISSWNVSSVTSANYIFCGCPMINQPSTIYPQISPPPIWDCF